MEEVYNEGKKTMNQVFFPGPGSLNHVPSRCFPAILIRFLEIKDISRCRYHLDERFRALSHLTLHGSLGQAAPIAVQYYKKKIELFVVQRSALARVRADFSELVKISKLYIKCPLTSTTIYDERALRIPTLIAESLASNLWVP